LMPMRLSWTYPCVIWQGHRVVSSRLPVPRCCEPAFPQPPQTKTLQFFHEGFSYPVLHLH
jgi:hypothetical protein